MKKPYYLMAYRALAMSFIPAVLILGGCVSDNSGMAAYKRGEYSTALKEFREDQTPEGDFALGLMFYKGEGVKRDYKEAASFFRQSAEQGHAGRAVQYGAHAS